MAVLAVMLLHGATAAAAETGTATQAVAATPTLTEPFSPTTPPRDHFLNANQATRIAARSPKLRAELAKHDQTTHRAFAKGPGRWQVSWYAGGKEIGQVLVDERTSRAIEVWTGPQAAWQMARGLPGAFGRKVNSPAVWIPLMVLFFVPFFDWRRPLRMLHLDLLVLLAFSLSHVFFNRGEISTSVPLVYPVLVYLLARMLSIAYRRESRPPRPLRLLVPVSWLALALIFLVGFRVGLNLTNSNVIDVGYSGVIGADRPHSRGGDLRQVSVRRSLRRHIRSRQLLRLRAVRARVSVVGQVGRPSGRSRGRAVLRPGDARRAASGSAAGCAAGETAPCSGSCSLTDGRAIRTRCSS